MAGILNIQLKPTLGNKELNLKKIEHFIKKYSDKNLIWWCSGIFFYRNFA